MNGHIEKDDAYFSKDFKFDIIGDKGILLGPYPQDRRGAQEFIDKGVTGVLNIQTESEMSFRGVPWDRVQDFYKERGV